MMTLMPNTGSQLQHSQATLKRSPKKAVSFDESRWQLVQQLQSSLDIELVLTYFFKALQQQVAVSSLNYSQSPQKIDLSFGKKDTHTCDYNLKTDTEILGTIEVSRNKRFSEKELSLVESLISTLILPLRNALHYRAALQTALHDPLTGLGNRIALQTTLDREMMLSERHNQPLSLLVIDLDHFKKINDTMGHNMGDAVLTHTAKLMQNTCRNSDVCYRYGGEEFVILLSNTNAAGAELIAERIRRVVEETPVEYNKREAIITASIGIAHYQNGDTTESLFERADKAMYIAKSTGRNQVANAIE
ncbi:MAG: GGDEF domain-containing protein [Cellvibrionaceae bacterium]